MPVLSNLVHVLNLIEDFLFYAPLFSLRVSDAAQMNSTPSSPAFASPVQQHAAAAAASATSVGSGPAAFPATSPSSAVAAAAAALTAAATTGQYSSPALAAVQGGSVSALSTSPASQTGALPSTAAAMGAESPASPAPQTPTQPQSPVPASVAGMRVTPTLLPRPLPPASSTPTSAGLATGSPLLQERRGSDLVSAAGVLGTDSALGAAGAAAAAAILHSQVGLDAASAPPLSDEDLVPTRVSITLHRNPDGSWADQQLVEIVLQTLDMLGFTTMPDFSQMEQLILEGKIFIVMTNLRSGGVPRIVLRLIVSALQEDRTICTNNEAAADVLRNYLMIAVIRATTAACSVSECVDSRYP